MLAVVVRQATIPRSGSVRAPRLVRLDQVDYEGVSGWVASLSGAGLSASSVRQTHRVLSLILRGAVWAKRLPASPAEGDDLVRAMEGRDADAFVFTAPDGGHLRSSNWRTRVLDRAVRAAGLVNVSPHDLRETAASLAAGSGCS